MPLAGGLGETVLVQIDALEGVLVKRNNRQLSGECVAAPATCRRGDGVKPGVQAKDGAMVTFVRLSDAELL